MRLEDLSPEQIKLAKACSTREERLAFIADNGIDLTDEEMDALAGGTGLFTGLFSGKKENCCGIAKKKHTWVKTGRNRPDKTFGNVFPDIEFRCTACGKTKWS